MNRFLPTLIALLICGLWQTARAENAPVVRLSTDQLRAAIIESQGRLHSLRVEYRVDDLRGQSDEPTHVSEPYLYRTVVIKQPSSFYQMTAHGAEKYRWQDDRFLERYFAVGREIVQEYPFSRAYRSYRLADGAALPADLQGEFFLVASGWWPLSDFPAPRLMGEPYMLADIARDERYQIVRPKQEQRDGRWCHVLELPGVQVLWIDVNRSCALMARQNWHPKTGALLQELRMGGHREFAPGVWGPDWAINTQYDYAAATPHKRATKVIHSRMTLMKGVANEVGGWSFEYRPPPGSLELDDTTGQAVQTQPDGTELLDTMIDGLRRSLPHLDVTRSGSSPSGLSALVLACGIWGIEAIRLLYRLRQKKRG